MDTLVFDIETKNFFTDPEVGYENFAALKISVVGMYSYLQDKYFCYTEHELGELAVHFRNASRIVGFSINRYDVPVLHNHFEKLVAAVAGAAGAGAKDPALDLYAKERVDLLDEVEMITGKRISLERLSQANLGEGKSGTGAHAIDLYKEGKIDELKSYCLKDVEITKKLFDLYRNQKFLYVPNRETEVMEKITFTPSYGTSSLF
jgi:Predicted 3'-5' exonuclease related to the exonuclease domain of PolB